MMAAVAGCALLLGGGIWAEKTRPWDQRTATAILQIVRHPSLLHDASLDDGEEYRLYQRTQVELFKSKCDQGDSSWRELPHTANERYHYHWDEVNLRVEIIEGTELVRVSLSGRSTLKLKRILSFLIENYAKSYLNETSGRIQMIRWILDGYQKELAIKREELSKLEEADRKTEMGPSPSVMRMRDEIEILNKAYMRVASEEREVWINLKVPRVRVISEPRVSP
jgi:hypothetical protein